MSPPPLKWGRYRPSIGPPGQMYPRYKCRQADLNSWGYKVFGNIGLRNSPGGGGRVSPISSRTIVFVVYYIMWISNAVIPGISLITKIYWVWTFRHSNTGVCPLALHRPSIVFDNCTNCIALTLMLLTADLPNTKWCKNPLKWLKPWHMSTYLRKLSESYLMNTNTTWFRWFSRIFAFLCFWWK